MQDYLQNFILSKVRVIPCKLVDLGRSYGQISEHKSYNLKMAAIFKDGCRWGTKLPIRNVQAHFFNTLDIRLTKNHDWICSLIW